MIRNTKKALLDLRAFEKLFLSQILGSDIDVSAVIIDNTPEVVMDAYIILAEQLRWFRIQGQSSPVRETESLEAQLL